MKEWLILRIIVRTVLPNLSLNQTNRKQLFCNFSRVELKEVKKCSVVALVVKRAGTMKDLVLVMLLVKLSLGSAFNSTGRAAKLALLQAGEPYLRSVLLPDVRIS